MIFVKQQNQIHCTVFLIIFTEIEIHKTPRISIGRKLNAAKQNGKVKLVNILRKTQYLVGQSVLISLWHEQTTVLEVVIRLGEMRSHARSWALRLVVVEVMHLANTAGQLALTNRFLGGEYLTHGLAMLTFLWGQPRQQNLQTAQ